MDCRKLSSGNVKSSGTSSRQFLLTGSLSNLRKLFDNTGPSCLSNKEGKVWFLFVDCFLSGWKFRQWRRKPSGNNWTKEFSRFRIVEMGIRQWYRGRRHSGASKVSNGTLSSPEAPAGYPYKNSNDRKNRKRAKDDGKREKFFPSYPARSLRLFLPSLPTTQRGLWGGEKWRNCKIKWRMILVVVIYAIYAIA